MDALWVLMVVALAAVPLALSLRKVEPGAARLLATEQAGIDARISFVRTAGRFQPLTERCLWTHVGLRRDCA